MTRRRRSEWPSVLVGVVIVAAGIAVAVVEFYRVRFGLPRPSVWIVVGTTVGVLLALRAASRRRE